MKKKRLQPRPLSLATRGVHGRRLGAFRGPVVTPVYQTSTFRFQNSGDAIRYAQGDPSVYVYTRYHNPTVDEVEDRIAFMEGGESAALFSSGMAAISTAVLALCESGDEIISTPSLYGGTYRFFRDALPQLGITVRYVDPSSLGDVVRLATRRTKLVYFETPTNPALRIIDIRQLVAMSRRAEAKIRYPLTVMIDNTFATCLNQQPFSFGVDAIVESATKFLNGHADMVGGVLVGRKGFIRRAKTAVKGLGGCADPFAAFLLGRSLKTFELRVRRQNENAMELARALEGRRGVLRVLYPGLRSHPQHRLAVRQMSGFGGMVTFEVRGGAKAAVRVCDNLKVAVNAMSLGGTETLVSIPVYSSHINMTAKELAGHGVTPGMVRVSTGVEGIDDLIADFRQALQKG